MALGCRDFRRGDALFAVAGYSAGSRLASWRRVHVARVRRNRAADYMALRRRLFGFEFAPLPDSLGLSVEDEESNRRAKLVPFQLV
jgi:hypothetical protein